MAPSPLAQSALSGVKVETLDRIAFDLDVRHSGNILKQKPCGPTFGNDPAKFAQHLDAFPARLRSPGMAEVLAWTAPDDPIEAAGRNVKASHISPPKQIRAANDAEAFSLESAAEKINTRED